jgi:hypothetical protein
LILASASVGCGGDSQAEPQVTIEPPAPTVSVDEPVPSPTAVRTRDRGGLWLYDDTGDGLIGLGLRVIPGAEPDVDSWRFEPGPYSPAPAVSCRPQGANDGWRFEACGDNAGFSAFMPREGETGLRISYGSSGRRTDVSLSRAEERDEPQSSPNVRLLWQHRPAGGALSAGIWVDNGVVYAPTDRGTVEVLDAATGELLGTADLTRAPLTGRGTSNAFEVTARNGVLYVGGLAKGLVIYDVRDPRAPRFVSQYIVDAGGGSRESFTNIHNLYLSPRGDILYAINQSHAATDLRLVDVTDPARPREAGRFAVRTTGDTLAGQHDIEVIERDGRLIGFLNHLSDGLYVLDVTRPDAVQQLAHVAWDGIFSHSGASFERNGRLYYAHTDEGFDQGLTVLDVTDLTAPKETARFKTRDAISIHNIEVVDAIAYVAYYVDGLRVIDLRDPARPREIAHYDTVAREEERGLFQGAWGISLAGGRAFISDIEGGIFAFDVTLPR